MYVKLFGQEIAFVNIDRAIIDQAIAVCPIAELISKSDRFKITVIVLRWSKDKLDKSFVFQQLATGPSTREYGMSALRALLQGISLEYAMPLLVSEVRRILPTTVGLPIELSLYSAAVATAAVEGMYVPNFVIRQVINNIH